jgi:hypothetical protein
VRSIATLTGNNAGQTAYQRASGVSQHRAALNFENLILFSI